MIALLVAQMHDCNLSARNTYHRLGQSIPKANNLREISLYQEHDAAQRSYLRAVTEMCIGVKGDASVVVVESKGWEAEARQHSVRSSLIPFRQLRSFSQRGKLNAEIRILARTRSTGTLFVALDVVGTTRLFARTDNHRFGEAGIVIAGQLNRDSSIRLRTKNPP